MNRNTIVEIAIPKALYESIKGKILKEDKKDLKEISAQTKYNAAVKATQDAESERGMGDDLFRAKRRQQAMAASTHINPAIESEARNIAKMLTKSTGAAGFRSYIYKYSKEGVPYVELIFQNSGNSDYYIEFVITKNFTKVTNQDYIPSDLERKLAVFVDKIRKAELDINTDDSTSSMNEAKEKNTHKIVLTFDDERRIKRIQTTPTFQKMLAPNQIKNLKVGDNELVVNNVALNGLERMESMGLYKLKKDQVAKGMHEAKKKPSAGLTKAEKSTIAKKAAAGKDIGKKGKGFEKVAAKAAKEYGSKEAGKKVAAAAMWKAQAGKKKMNEEEEMYDLYIINPEKRWNRSAPYWVKIKDTSKPMTKAEVHKMELELMHDPHVGGYPKEYWTVVKAGEYPEEPAKEPELPKEDLKTNQNIIQRILSKITGKKKVNEYDDYDAPTPDGEYRNPNNRTYDDGTYFVASYDTGRAKFRGTYEQCEQYIENKLDGDFDDYGIFQN